MSLPKKMPPYPVPSENAKFFQFSFQQFFTEQAHKPSQEPRDKQGLGSFGLLPCMGF